VNEQEAAAAAAGTHSGNSGALSNGAAFTLDCTPKKKKLVKKTFAAIQDSKPKAVAQDNAGPPPPPAGMTITTCKTRSGDVVAQTRRGQMHAYIYPVVEWMGMKDHKKMVHDWMKVHFTGFERHPNNDEVFKVDPPSGKSKLEPRYTLFVMFVPSDKESSNTAENRKAWANGIIALANSPAIQQKYRYGDNMVTYNGDITPAAAEAAPYLSDFLTVNDTMTAICESYADHDTDVAAAAADIILDDTILDLYYRPHQINRVKAKFAATVASPGDEFGIGAFVPHFNL